MSNPEVEVESSEKSSKSSEIKEAQKKAKKEYEEKVKKNLQKRIKEVAVETKSKVISFLKKYLLGKKDEDRKKVVESSKDEKGTTTDKEASKEELQNKFDQIQDAQAKGLALTEEQQALLANVSADAAVDLNAQKQIKAEVPEAPEPSQKIKPNLATIPTGSITPEMLLRYDFSDYELDDDGEGGQILVLKTSEEVLKDPKAFVKKSIQSGVIVETNPVTLNSLVEKNGYKRRFIPESEVPPELAQDPEFKKEYQPIEQDGQLFFKLRDKQVPNQEKGGAPTVDLSRAEIPAEEVTEGMLKDPRFKKFYTKITYKGKEIYMKRMGGGDGSDGDGDGDDGDDDDDMGRISGTSGRRLRDSREPRRTVDSTTADDMTAAEEAAERRRREGEGLTPEQIAALTGGGIPGMGIDPRLLGRRENVSWQNIENTFLPPPLMDGEKETDDSYQQRLKEARDRYFNQENRAIELEAGRKSAVYLAQVIERAKSEEEVSWIIEDSLRSGENDLISPDTFQGAVQQVIQAVDLVFGSNQSAREKFTKLARARMAGYACEFTARYINATGLAENITNYFQDYFEAMRDLPGVRRMMEMMEAADTSSELDEDGHAVNIRGSYFRKLNFAKNQAKRDEWDKYYVDKDGSLKELYDEDGKPKKEPAWAQWVVDKKFQLYKEALANNEQAKLDYLNDFKDPEDEELIRVLLVKTHGKNDPVAEIKKLHQYVFSEQYADLGDTIPKIDPGYVSDEIKNKLHENEKFKKAIRVLSEDEKQLRGSLSETKTALTQSLGVPLDRLIYQLSRSVSLAQRMEHSLQFSTHWDNLRWKKRADMTPEQQKLFDQAVEDIKHADHATGRHDLDQFGRNVTGGLVILNPVVKWAMNNDPRSKGSIDKERHNIEKQLFEEKDEKKREELQKKLSKLSNKEISVNLRVAGEKRARKTLLKYKIKFEKDPDAKKKMQDEIEKLEADGEINAIDHMRNAKNHLFTIAVDKTYRDFYEKYWELIDHEGSFSGDSSREARKAQYFGRTLEQSGEAEPGKRFLRRFADTGAKDIGMFFAFESGFDMIENFNSVFNRVKRWSAVMKQGDKLRGVLMDMLNNPEILADPVKFTTEIKKNYRPHLSTDDTFDREYYSDEDYFEAYHGLENQLDYVTGQWAEAIIEYNKTHSWQQHSADLRQEVLTKAVANMVGHELITAHRATHILDEQFGKLPKRILYEITHVLLKPKEGMWALISEIIQGSNKALNQGFKAA